MASDLWQLSPAAVNEKPMAKFARRQRDEANERMFNIVEKVNVRRLIAFCTYCSIQLSTISAVGAATVQLVCDAEASPRVALGVERLKEAIVDTGFEVLAVDAATVRPEDTVVTVGRRSDAAVPALAPPVGLEIQDNELGPEGFSLLAMGSRVEVIGEDDSGILYGCLELASRVRGQGGLPNKLAVTDRPAFKLRGTCIGMQKPYLLPGRKIYEYPYTEELFPFFYDKAFWREYLDFLVDRRMNLLSLWNGHPFGSLVRLDDYPYAVEVSDEQFERNVATYRYIAEEADRRGIWLTQMFYNILLPAPLAERHQLQTQLASPTPLAADYTRKAIAEFVRQYPNVGLHVCLGEATLDVGHQVEWLTEVILPGVHDGMRRAGLQNEPPVMIRAHATDPSIVIPAALDVYRNLYTESKYNGESLTTWRPRGSKQRTHLELARLGSTHVVNVHILANLEPFRYGAQRFIKKSVQAARDRLDAGGLHVYPLAYWNWPHSADAVHPPLLQINRDWMWFDAWSRYAWDPDIDAGRDRLYWVGRLTEQYGSPEAAPLILSACNDAGECAPRLARRLGITEGNRQTHSLGMTLDQLVNPEKYNAYPDLWLSQAPPGERLQEYVQREWEGLPHEGETPPEAMSEALRYAEQAVASINAAAGWVRSNLEEFERLRNDIHCIQAMSRHYAAKADAAGLVLRHRLSNDPNDLQRAAERLEESLTHYRQLTRLTDGTYRFANSLQIGHRRIPFRGVIGDEPAYFHWRQVEPPFEKELKQFLRQLSDGRAVTDRNDYRVLVSTDVGGTDPDDFQSMVHLLVYADSFDLEGLVSSPYGLGRKEHIRKVIDAYEHDYPNLKSYADKYPTPDALRAICKQGAIDTPGQSGFGEPTEGSEWIIQCARRDDPRPLHVLVWGGIEDLAQALHDAPDILAKLRVYWIGGPNKKWSVDAYNYIEQNHPKLWMIEANATYRGWFVGGNQKGEWSNKEFVAKHITEHGALGELFFSKKADIKMGDTPSLARLIRGVSDDPTQPGWGGKYVRIWDGRKTVFDRHTTAADKSEVFGVTEFVLPVPEGYTEENSAKMIFSKGRPASIGENEGQVLRFRFSPRDAKVWSYKIESDFAGLDGQSGEFDAIPPPIERTSKKSTVHPNWWIDDPDPAAAVGVHPGAKSVSQWREAYLGDFAERMDRCKPLRP